MIEQPWDLVVVLIIIAIGVLTISPIKRVDDSESDTKSGGSDGR